MINCSANNVFSYNYCLSTDDVFAFEDFEYENVDTVRFVWSWLAVWNGVNMIFTRVEIFQFSVFFF